MAITVVVDTLTQTIHVDLGFQPIVAGDGALSPDVGNQAVLRPNGIYVPTPSELALTTSDW